VAYNSGPGVMEGCRQLPSAFRRLHYNMSLDTSLEAQRFHYLPLLWNASLDIPVALQHL
jgi:hypothetical protein